MTPNHQITSVIFPLFALAGGEVASGDPNCQSGTTKVIQRGVAEHKSAETGTWHKKKRTDPQSAEESESLMGSFLFCVFCVKGRIEVCP